MSRRSQAFAEGPAKFTWRFERLADGAGRERMKCHCVNHPTIIGWGDDEQTAMRAATKAMTDAVERVDISTAGPGAHHDPVTQE